MTSKVARNGCTYRLVRVKSYDGMEVSMYFNVQTCGKASYIENGLSRLTIISLKIDKGEEKRVEK